MLAAVRQKAAALIHVNKEFKFLFRDEFKDLTLEQIQDKLPELFL